MFPICDEQGRVIGFSGRVLSGDEKTAKYVNSPETPIFTKSQVFFGLDKSKRAMLDAGFAVVCEGQLDLIACFMGGVQNVVAPQGTAFTASTRASSNVTWTKWCCVSIPTKPARTPPCVRWTICWRPAWPCAWPSCPRRTTRTVSSRPTAARRFASSSKTPKDFSITLLNRLCKLNDANSDKGRNAILRGMAEAVHKTGNVVLIDKYAQKTALRLGVSPEAVRAEFSKFKVQGSGFKVQESESGEPALEPETETPRPNRQEFWLLKLLLLHDELVAWAALHLDVNWIAHPLVRQIVKQRLAAQTNETWKSMAAFLDECETTEMRSLITEAVAEDRKLPNPDRQLADVVLYLRNQFLDRQIAASIQRASQPETSETERMELLREQQELRKQKRAPLHHPSKLERHQSFATADCFRNH